MKISIIIPTIRSEHMINFQLQSLTHQTFPKEKFEIIIVDDCPIGRRNEIENFGKSNDLNIKWMRSKKPYYRSNANIGCARNTGLVRAEGKLIVFIDDFSVVRHRYLEKVWDIYRQDKKFSHIGPVISVEYQDNPPENINELKIRHTDPRSTKGKSSKIGHHFKKCKSEWFFTSNASAPLKNLIEVNGFWEMADLTREEDVLMGYALERVGRKFCFIDNIDISTYHMTHDIYKMERKYKEITFKDLGWEDVIIDGRTITGYGGQGRNGLNTSPDEIQRVTKDIFGTKNPGSWALIEHFKKNKNLKFNRDIGFDLAKERKKIGL